jgi:hypothetical protein
MKKLIISGILLFIISSANSQELKTDVLQDLEKTQPTGQVAITTATLKTASRLFRDKDDLTSVVIVIPQDAVVNVLGSEDTFLYVDFEGNEGYIGADHAEINKDNPVANPVPAQSQTYRKETYVEDVQPAQQQRVSRYTYLENKYGRSMAARIYSGKIWKGMNAGMVQDSWGSPKKINRFISGNTVKEEWFYNGTMLYFQNSTLTDWGPIRD